MQRTPHPVHAPPVADAPRMVPLSRRRLESYPPAVDADTARYSTRYFVAWREAVQIRRADGGPLQIHADVHGAAGLAAQQSGRVGGGLARGAPRHPVHLQ